MEILKIKHYSVVFLAACLIVAGCSGIGSTVTVTYPIETDTYISNLDSNDHSELNFLSVAKSGSAENRILIKYPTGNYDDESNLNDCINNPVCFVFFMPLAILQYMISPNCLDSSYTAANLNWAYLAFDTVDGSSPAAGALQISLVAQPWWHNASWLRSHPFTESGEWLVPGGTLDTSVSFEDNCTNLQGGQSCGAGEVKFEMTDYFKSLLSSPNSTHYGMVISAPVDVAEIRLHSSQASSSVGPRLVANYNCISPSSKQQSKTSTFYLGTPIP